MVHNSIFVNEDMPNNHTPVITTVNLKWNFSKNITTTSKWKMKSADQSVFWEETETIEKLSITGVSS